MIGSEKRQRCEEMNIQELKKLERGLVEMARRRDEDKLSFYNPYPKQQTFHDWSRKFRERLFMAGNRCGKSYCGAAEVAMHLTGRYPEDWLGRRWERPIKVWVASKTAELTRDVAQELLLGTQANISIAGIGRGLIPKACLDPDKTSMARGVSKLFDSVLVKHYKDGKVNGWSELYFKSFDRGREAWQGSTLDLLWFDEEPPMDVYQEGLTRVATTRGMVFVTFTPLLGKSEVVSRYLDEPSADRGYVQMELAEAKHIPDEEKKKISDGYLPHEREARAKGIPMLGSGKVFVALEEDILVETFTPPKHWRYVWGIDPGIDHPFGAVLLGYDVDADVLYVMHAYRAKGETQLQHAYALKQWNGGFGAKVPVAWPQDAWQRKEFEGQLKSVALIYKKHGLRMLDEHAKFADGGNSTWAGILEMRERMATGRFKVFRHLTQWIEEYREYHIKDGELVKKKDDLMSATRIAVMMKRKAQAVLWFPGSQDGRGPQDQKVARDVDFSWNW